mmetsp:Transcript_15456/g.60459  ORF Transcript_15456/g.60459 Transcript_15456/m.60459 type:complete len:202 (+) Transcript_15456:1044-1649(+)
MDGCFCHRQAPCTMNIRGSATAKCARLQSTRCVPEAVRAPQGWVARDALSQPPTQLARTRTICTAGCDACRKLIAPMHRPGIPSSVLPSAIKFGAKQTLMETTILPAQTQLRMSQKIPICRLRTKTLRRADAPKLSPLTSPNQDHLASLGRTNTNSSRKSCISNGAGVPLHPALLKCVWFMTALLVTLHLVLKTRVVVITA